MITVCAATLGVPVFVAFEPFEYRSQGAIATGLVLFDGRSFPRYIGDTSRQAGSAFRRQDAPPEYPIRAFEERVSMPGFEQVFQDGVQRLRFWKREVQIYPGWFAGRSQRRFSRYMRSWVMMS